MIMLAHAKVQLQPIPYGMVKTLLKFQRIFFLNLLVGNFLVRKVGEKTKLYSFSPFDYHQKVQIKAAPRMQWAGSHSSCWAVKNACHPLGWPEVSNACINVIPLDEEGKRGWVIHHSK
jgi:hypothetical protein